MAVTHDRYFLDNVAGWILELDRGAGIPYEGNYSGWLEQKKARLAVEEKQESARQKALSAEIRATLPVYANWPTFPQLFVEGELVGGCDIVREMFESGELEQLFKDKGVSLAKAA